MLKKVNLVKKYFSTYPHSSFYSKVMFEKSNTKTQNNEEELNTEIYKKALDYWNSVASNVDGMLGGFPQLHVPDINASKQFISSLRKSNILLNDQRALDCGSGIGRITKHLLLPMFKIVDMVDVAETFIQNSKKYIGEAGFSRVGQQYVDSLHTFKPQENYYDLIWIQWVSGHLSNNDFVEFLKRCKLAIREGGCIVIKENITSGVVKDFDPEDNSWTRPKHEILDLLKKAGVEILADKKQLNFPKGIYEVRMMALRGVQHIVTSSESDDMASSSGSETSLHTSDLGNGTKKVSEEISKDLKRLKLAKKSFL